MADIQDSNITPLRPKAERLQRTKLDRTNSERDDEVITKPFTPEQALTRLREVGAVEGIAEFARMAGWEGTAASRLASHAELLALTGKQRPRFPCPNNYREIGATLHCLLARG